MKVLLSGICVVLLTGCCHSAIPSEREVKDALEKASEINEIKAGLDLLERDLDTRTTSKCPMSLSHGKRLHSDANMDRRVSNALLASRILMQDGQYSLNEVGDVQHIFTRENGETCVTNNAPTYCNFTSIYRTADGSCNNKDNPEWGMAGRPHSRVVKNDYDDKISDPRTLGLNDGLLPNPRIVSNEIHRTVGNVALSDKLTLYAMAFGQFLDHDITLTPEIHVEDCCAETNRDDTDKCFNIIIPEDEKYQPLFTEGYCMQVKRSSPLLCEDPFSKDKVRQQKNAITSFIDASNVYGSSEEQQKELRDENKPHLLKTSMDGNRRRILDGNDADCITGGGQHCSKAGDARVNEVPSLTSMHYLFVLEHNRIARNLTEFYEDSDVIFEETRRIIIAIMQKITYNEFLAAFLSTDALKKYELLSSVKYKYEKDTDPTVINAFATAAYRAGHTWVSKTMDLFKKDFHLWKNETHKIEETFHRPDLTYLPQSFARLAYWLSGAKSPDTDAFLVDGIRDDLFLDMSEKIAFDLAALNVQRGRDHGLGSYNDYRTWCDIKPPVKRKWGSSRPLPGHTDEMTKKLQTAGYRSPMDIDLFTGGLSEKPVVEGSFGPTFECILGEQFRRLKFGDRYWYQNKDAGFTKDQIDAIEKYTYSKLLCNNYNYETVQYPSAFNLKDEKKECVDIPDLKFDVFNPNPNPEKKVLTLNEQLKRLIETLEGK
ncbi:peroxidasin homolog pxn-2-like [Mercenaria mercenaria]|uniref:peroxidasin homolog pxn-2-like n=1 Tax=Mercenaria mercenaria TaxID=6596 RepID=UPI00234EED39|nr:peroxidasin homolog pxn-2-like [Mercenaria mercenaria]